MTDSSLLPHSTGNAHLTVQPDPHTAALDCVGTFHDVSLHDTSPNRLSADLTGRALHPAHLPLTYPSTHDSPKHRIFTPSTHKYKMPEKDTEVLTRQLGRPPRGVLGVAARCACGEPAVITTAPRLPDGQPFPTFYYLTLPKAVAVFSGLEASGFMREANHQLATNIALQNSYAVAHKSYIAQRNTLGYVPEIEDISAGGMPHRVKCLHALVAHELATGANPIGNMALSAVNWSLRHCEC